MGVAKNRGEFFASFGAPCEAFRDEKPGGFFASSVKKKGSMTTVSVSTGPTNVAVTSPTAMDKAAVDKGGRPTVMNEELKSQA